MARKNILLIEDELSIRDIYQMILEDEGYDVVCANNGKQGLEFAERSKPDLILMDLMMPVLGGEATIRELRKTEWGKNIPIIILTNIGSTEVPEEIIDENIKQILVKVELTPDQLVEKVKQTLDTKL